MSLKEIERSEKEQIQSGAFTQWSKYSCWVGSQSHVLRESQTPGSSQAKQECAEHWLVAAFQGLERSPFGESAGET